MTEFQYIGAVEAARIDGVQNGRFEPNARDKETLRRITTVGDYMRDGMQRDQIKKLHPDWDVDWLCAMAVRSGVA